MQSFRDKLNPQHHLSKEDSPLLDIVNFDPIKNVILDEMHMLYLGISKFIIQKLVLKKSISYISQENITALQQNLTNFAMDITCEFQRKTFDLMDLKNWKATQFRCFLLYSSAIVLKNVMQNYQHQHFLILYASCRILSSSKLATLKSLYVKQILKIFVELMPHYYGPSSQTKNVHNLIHIADDVIHIGSPISEFSAFDFENSLGYIKSLINSPTNPIAQIQRKLHIFHSSNSTTKIPLVYPINTNTKYSLGNIMEESESGVKFSFVNIYGYKITALHPDNICLLSNGNIMIVTDIFSAKFPVYKWNNIYLKGNVFNEISDFFSYPLSSRDIGLYNVKHLNPNNIEINILMVDVKCILTTLNNERVAHALLHK